MTAVDSPTRSTRIALLLVAAIVTVLAMMAWTSATPAKADWINGYKHDYQGRIANGKIHYFGFDRNKDRISKLSLFPPLACPGEIAQGNIIPVTVIGKFKIKNDKLVINDQKVRYRIPGESFKLKGRLTLKLTFKGKKGKKVSGTVKPTVRLPFDGGVTCTFGTLPLKAKKGARVNLVL